MQNRWTAMLLTTLVTASEAEVLSHNVPELLTLKALVYASEFCQGTCPSARSIAANCGVAGSTGFGCAGSAGANGASCFSLFSATGGVVD